MPWEAWTTLVVIGLMAVALMRNMGGPDVVLVGGLTILMTLSLFSPTMFLHPGDAVAGFGNEGLITIAVLFVVAEGLGQTGAMNLIAQPLLGMPRTRVAAQFRLMAPVAFLSAFLNNTPIVAMFMPVVSDWCRKSRLSPSKLFIPLSYATILGGTCSLIGTATNLLVMGMVQKGVDAKQFADPHIGMFSLAAVGIPASIVGIGYILLTSGKLLPDRIAPRADADDARRYTVEMMVAPGSPIDGKSIEQAGLRHLPGTYVMGIERDDDRIAPVSPSEILRGNDRLIFVGIVESVVDLQKIRGLVPATDQVHKLRSNRGDRVLIEAVVSDTCPLLGKSIREGRFRSMYDAAVIAVHRGGHHMADVKIGDIVLRPGDTLLLETHPNFIQRERNRRDFFLVSALEGSRPVRHDRAWIALVCLLVMVVLGTAGVMKLLNAALIASALMILAGCCTAQQARSAINWRVLLAMGAALGIGANLKSTGAADAVAQQLISLLAPWGPVAILGAVYLLTMVFAESVGHAGSAAIMFPIAQSAALIAGPGGTPVSFKPFIIVIMIAAAATFATPIGYQTNLMVYGAGGYRFSDYVRFGLPLNLLIMAVVVTLTPMIWPLAIG